MAKTRRGGKRPGAGSKPKLSWDQRLNLGAEAEKRLAEVAQARLRAIVAARNDRLNLREKWARLDAIRSRHVEQLPELPDHLQRRQLRAQLMKDDDVEEALLDVRDAITALYGSHK